MYGGLLMLVRELKNANRRAVNEIKNYPYQKHSNLFFEGLFTSAWIAEPARMYVEEAV